MYKVDISSQAEKDLELHKKSGQKIVQDRIAQIFKELKIHPRTGIGNPEKKKYKYAGFWSREISKKHRMLYKIEDNIVTVTVFSAIGHYEDK